VTAEPYDFDERSVGISFQVASRRRFIPNVWLLHADLNERQTEIEVHYTHAVVTLAGRNLASLHQHIAKFGVSGVREILLTPRSADPAVTRIEITEKGLAQPME
jgi:hypothetical protein